MLQEVEISSSTAASSTITSPTSSVAQGMWYVAGWDGTTTTAGNGSNNTSMASNINVMGGSPAGCVAVLAEVQLLERHVELMRLFFQHITRCPPHGPFRYYSAMSFVEQTRALYAQAAGDNNEDNGEMSPEELSIVYGDDAAAVRRAVTIPNVLALMERYFNTRHLCNWPLLYVPAEIHLADIDQLAAAQYQQQQQQRK